MEHLRVDPRSVTAPGYLLRDLLHIEFPVLAAEVISDVYVPDQVPLPALNGSDVRVFEETKDREPDTVKGVTQTEAPLPPPLPIDRARRFLAGVLSELASNLYKHQRTLWPHRQDPHRNWINRFGPRPSFSLLMTNREKLVSIWHALTPQQKRILVPSQRARQALDEKARLKYNSATLLPAAARRLNHTRLRYLDADSPAPTLPHPPPAGWRRHVPQLYRIQGENQRTLNRIRRSQLGMGPSLAA